MKRKFLAVILISVILCLGGCGANLGSGSISTEGKQENQKEEISGSTEVPKEETETNGQEQTEASKEPQEPVTTQPPAPSVNEQGKTNEYLQVTFERTYDNAYDESGDWISLMYGHYDSIHLLSDEYPELTKAVEAFNLENSSGSQSYLDELEEWAREEYREYGAESFRGPYVSQEEMFLRRADSQVLSVVEQFYSYAGGAHGNAGFYSVSFDVQTGEEIPLEAVIKDKKQLLKVLETEISEKYPDLEHWAESLAEALQFYDEPLDPELKAEFTWTLDYDGVTFYFSNYDIAAYVAGVQQVTLSYYEYPELMEGSYFINAPKDYVLPLNDYAMLSDVDLTGDGTTDYISVWRKYSDFADFSESYDVSVNGNSFTQEIYCYDLETYLVKNDGKNYLYVQRTVENDFQSVCVFEITENSVEYIGEFNGGLKCFINPKDFQVTSRFDMLSTYLATADCFLGERGMPVEKGGAYQIDFEQKITSTVEISAELLDESGNLTGDTYTFPVGTAFGFLETDGATYVDMQADDGKRCRFYTTPQWPQTINGMDANSCFEMLWYAG